MTAVLDDDWTDIRPDGIEAQAGPLTGSRGTTRSGTGRAPATGTRQTRLEKKLGVLQGRLSKEMFGAGAMIGMGLHVTGYYICQESDNFTTALVQLAARKPEWIEALEHIADLGPGITVGRTVLGMGAALAVDRGRADPERQFMRFLGVTAAWAAVNGETGGSGNGSASSYVPPPHGTFVPVS
jgi:hypothetical protein